MNFKIAITTVVFALLSLCGATQSEAQVRVTVGQTHHRRPVVRERVVVRTGSPRYYRGHGHYRGHNSGYHRGYGRGGRRGYNNDEHRGGDDRRGGDRRGDRGSNNGDHRGGENRDHDNNRR